MSEEIIDVEASVEVEPVLEPVKAPMRCPTPGCGWQWFAPFNPELGLITDPTARYCAMCSTPDDLVAGVVILPEDWSLVHNVAETEELTPDETALAKDLLLLVGSRSPNLKVRRFIFAGQPAACLYEHLNPEGTFGRIRPLALLLTPALLRALRPSQGLTPASAVVSGEAINQKGDDGDEASETNSEEAV
jgi:hypothetical protein